MSEKMKCPVCGSSNDKSTDQCLKCDADLKAIQTDSRSRPGSGDPGKNDAYEDEFKELDYRPKSKKGLLAPVSVIIAVLIIVLSVFFLFQGDTTEEEAKNIRDVPVDVPGFEGPKQNDPEDDPGSDNTAEAIDADEDLPDLDSPFNDRGESPDVDYDQVEAALLNWLINRVNDPTVVMLEKDELEDYGRFYERYDPDEDNIIVYKIQSIDGEFVTAVFGPPFSEWTIRAVFIWDQVEWRFLREESVR